MFLLNSKESDKKPGVVAFHYNYATNPSNEGNHCAIYLGHNTYLESSSANNGVRIRESNEFYDKFYTYFANLKKDERYYKEY